MDSKTYILDLADHCVKCGLCLPECPTYVLTANENESPRGRIALIQGWLTGELLPTPTLMQHLDQCLLCRRCERVCPSLVSYGEIMDQSKALLMEETKASFSMQAFITRYSLKLILNKTISKYIFLFLRLLQKTGLIFLATKTKLVNLLGMQRLITYLPALDKAVKTEKYYPANSEQKHQGNVALFTGCISKQLEPKTISASIKLLNQLGYGVYVPQQQVCCGALHLHDGDLKQATHFANSNISTFNQQKNITAILSVVNGCTAQLREYPHLKTAASFVTEVKDIIEFLAEIDWPENIKFNAFNKKIALQIPCSLQNSLRAEEKLLNLLKRIPELSLSSIYNRCCGAAGSYFLRHAELSDQLKKQAIDKLCEFSPDIIISSNLGCALQLNAGLSQRNNPPQVIHPIVLLEQLIKN